MSTAPTTTDNPIHIYTQMIGGAFARGSTVDIHHTVSLIAQDLLGAEQLHLMTAVSDNWVFYLAVPSRALASAPGFVCPLAAALPDHPDHQGDGAYLLMMAPYAAAVIRRGVEMRYLVGYTHEVTEEIETAGVQTIDVSRTIGRPLRTRSWLYRNLTTKAAALTSKVSLAMLLGSGLVYLASHAVAGYLSAGQATRAQALAAQANAAIEAAQLSPPLGKQLNRISTLSNAVVRTGGWIDAYQFSAPRGERFTASLPGWVTADVIKELGEGVRTELQAADNLVWAIKPDSSGQAIPGVGPNQVSVKAGDKR